MRIRRGDTVELRRGAERGKRGKVLRVDQKRDAVTVEGLHLVTKHVRPRRQGAKGETVKIARSIPASKVSLVCPQCSRATRVGIRMADGTRQRACKKCNSVI